MLYDPPQFRDRDEAAQRAFIAEVGFATLVTLGGEGSDEAELDASLIPLLFEPEGGPQGCLIGHVSRANPQWRRVGGRVAALALFQAHDHYVSPGWYPSKQEHGKVVPTWNYELVAVWGRLTVTEAPAEVLRIVTRLTERHEGRRVETAAARGAAAEPWAVSDAPEDFVAGMLKGIVGLSLAIERVQGKRKLSQNRPPADVAGVRAGLECEAPAGGLAATLAAFDKTNG